MKFKNPKKIQNKNKKSHCRQNFTDHTNFDNFGMALLTLTRVATTDAWSKLYRDATVQPPACSTELGNCGVPFLVSAVYFVSFVAIVSMIMINLVVCPLSHC
jgi:hypothetical protein